MSQENVKSQKSINDKLLLSNIHQKLEKLEKDMQKSKGLRLTNYQKENIALIFVEFVESTYELEQKSFREHDNLYIFSEEYQLLILLKDFLYKKPFSIFACFHCKNLVTYQQKEYFKKEKRKLFHKCSQEILGEGVSTNWKALYYLFYKDNEIRTLLMQYLKTINKENM